MRSLRRTNPLQCGSTSPLVQSRGRHVAEVADEALRTDSARVTRSPTPLANQQQALAAAYWQRWLAQATAEAGTTAMGTECHLAREYGSSFWEATCHASSSMIGWPEPLGPAVYASCMDGRLRGGSCAPASASPQRGRLCSPAAPCLSGGPDWLLWRSLACLAATGRHMGS